MEAITSFLDGIKLGGKQSHRNLTLFPIMAPEAGVPQYLTLEEALARGSVTITEVSEGGSVRELRLINSSPKAVLIVEGEELVGAKQNRIVNSTFLVPGGKEVIIPVSCVEQGRWHYRSRSFNSGGKVMHASLRKVHQRAVGDSLAEDESYQSNQGAIWSELSLKADRMSIKAPTGAMTDLFESCRDRLEEFTNAFRLVDCQVGAVFALNGRISGMECFLYQETFGKFFKKLVESYALDALDEELSRGDFPPCVEDPQVLVQEVRRARFSQYPSIGLGLSVRFESEALVGAALMEDGKVLHMTVFRDQDPSRLGRVGFQRFSERRRKLR